MKGKSIRGEAESSASTVRSRVARLLASIAIVVVFALPAPAQGHLNRALIPVAGERIGFAGTHWRTSVVIFNDGNEPVDAVVTAVGHDDTFLIVTVGPGESYAFDDQTLGLPGHLYPLEISSISSRPLRIAAAAYAFHLGKVSPGQPIAIVGADPSPAATLIRPITFDEEVRANLGIVNLEEQPVTVTFAVRKLERRNVAVTSIVVPPRTLLHAPIQSYFPLLPTGSGLSIVVDAGGRRVVSYGSIVRNDSNEAEFLIGVPTIP